MSAGLPDLVGARPDWCPPRELFAGFLAPDVLADLDHVRRQRAWEALLSRLATLRDHHRLRPAKESEPPTSPEFRVEERKTGRGERARAWVNRQIRGCRVSFVVQPNSRLAVAGEHLTA